MTLLASSLGVENKALQKAEYSEFRIFAKFKPRLIEYIQYIWNKSCQNQIFIFAKNSFQLEYLMRALLSGTKLVVIRHFKKNEKFSQLRREPKFLK